MRARRSNPSRHVPRTIRRLAVVAVLAAGTGCSSSAAPPATTAADVTTTTAAPAPTDAPTTTQAPNAATPLVRQAVLDYWAASRACAQRPKQCNPSSFTASHGTLRADVQSYVAMLLQHDYHLGPAGGDGGYVSINAITVDLAGGTTATTDECVDDPSPLLGPPGADGTPSIVSTSDVPRHFRHTLYLEGGTWRAGDEVIDTSSACDTPPETVPVDFTVPGS